MKKWLLKYFFLTLMSCSKSLPSFLKAFRFSTGKLLHEEFITIPRKIDDRYFIENTLSFGVGPVHVVHIFTWFASRVAGFSANKKDVIDLLRTFSWTKSKKECGQLLECMFTFAKIGLEIMFVKLSCLLKFLLLGVKRFVWNKKV